ncbi:hypothetical protein [Mesorhizobium atlanticum]|uniref:Uncharacterized protein n=1 Tax=Mesorhizobium atlanticum TaxID=2233532 RepID=A0A330GJM7_9HYPH|nr:hypothetical protein [Mesorhizobium atlanticum]RAZ72988.1 hypothetical protein DPM35_26750 [Mesorhizobium atlanticum]
MSRYLMSSQCVFDVIKRRNLDAELWLEAADARGIYADDICISAVTPMTIRWQLEQALTAARAKPEAAAYPVPLIRDFIDQANRFFEDFARDDRIIAMDHRIAVRWGDLLDMKITYGSPDGRLYDVPSATKVEIATALVGRGDFPFVYVDYHQDAHAGIPGLAVENPEKFSRR